MTYCPSRNTTPGDHVRPGADHDGKVGSASPTGDHVWRSTELSTGTFKKSLPVVYA
jgi:hypothetical protein